MRPIDRLQEQGELAAGAYTLAYVGFDVQLSLSPLRIRLVEERAAKQGGMDERMCKAGRGGAPDVAGESLVELSLEDTEVPMGGFGVHGGLHLVFLPFQLL
jgi:hypothetical protein